METDWLNRITDFAVTMTRGNLDVTERRLSLAAGTGLLFGSIVRSPMRRVLMTAAGGYLLYRGLSGRCPLSEQLALGTPPQRLTQNRNLQEDVERLRSQGELFEGRDERTVWEPPGDIDVVDEASMESFPASDAPGYTGTSAIPSDAVRGQQQVP